MTERSLFLRDHFRKLSKQLKAQADVAGSLDHASTVGSLREKFIRHFLKPHLPRTMELRSGKILDSTGMRSPQQDCVVVDTRFPLIDVGDESAALILAESVIATIEIKSFLDGEQVKKTLQANTTVRQLQRTGAQIYEKGGVHMLLSPPNPILQYIFAYEGLEADTLARHVADYATQENNGGAAPDAICVLGRGILLRSPCMPVKVGNIVTLPPLKNPQLLTRVLREDALYAFFRRFVDDVVPLRMSNWELDAYYSIEELS